MAPVLSAYKASSKAVVSLTDKPLHTLQWLVVVGSVVAFGFGWGTGANDVANAFATSVGSRTLKLWHAVIIAAVFEFCGALLLGRVSTNTIAGGIADINAFTSAPEVYAYGMVCALFVGTVWLIITSKMGLNVSSTHSIIGAIVGFALVWAGKDGVIWAVRDNTGASFPPYKGLISIILAWFIAPVLSGAAAALFFFIARTAVLRRKNAYAISFWILPLAVLATVWVCMYFVFTKGAKKALSSNSSWNDAKAAWVSALIAGGTAVLVAVVALPLLQWRASKAYDENGQPRQVGAKALPTGAIISEEDLETAMPTKDVSGSDDLTSSEGHKRCNPTLEAAAVLTLGTQSSGRSLGTWKNRMWKGATHGLTVDIHSSIKKDTKLTEMHAAAELFEPRVEYAFSYLQVFSAICVIFSHGAGEVGYMAGPLATIWDVYQKGTLTKSVSPPVWIVLIGALGLVIGLATYGYNVTRAMGVKLAKLTPSRGFCAELATAFVIMIAAQYGLPTSSSQCITGAIIGVGVLEGANGVNWKQFARQFASWVATLFIVGAFTAALFSQGVYAPGKIDKEQVISYKTKTGNLTNTLFSDFNTTLYQYRSAAQTPGALTRLSGEQWASLNRTVGSAYAKSKSYVDPKKPTTVSPTTMMNSLYQAVTLVQNNAVNALGQNSVFPGANVCNSNDTAALQAGNAVAACKAPRLVPAGIVASF